MYEHRALERILKTTSRGTWIKNRNEYEEKLPKCNHLFILNSTEEFRH